MRVCLLFVTLAVLLCGCTSRRTRLMDERSMLLEQRDKLYGNWHPRTMKDLSEDNDPAAAEIKPEERLKTIDQRVAEIDTQLLEMR